MLKRILFILALIPATACAELISLHTKKSRDSNPAQIIRSSINTKPTIVLFYKKSCTYCHYLRPLFCNIAKADDEMTFIEIEMSHNDRFYKQAYNFNTVPQVLYFNNGTEKLRHGSDNKNKTANQMKQHIKAVYSTSPKY